ncbi:DUF3626 domain-containing protein, partial [Rhodococcus kroppenstedtii]|uniref:DUF3626 domain-containing protein n=1 Tax=Rhodococcoides kroppenstedtii TaxID=293050 RepID=UPI001C9A9CD6
AGHPDNVVTELFGIGLRHGYILPAVPLGTTAQMSPIRAAVPFAGGDRWKWESRLFAGRYDRDAAINRPVYGAWNRRADPYGAAIRFGSSYLRLHTAAIDRATFCFPDSVFEPVDVGGAELLPYLRALADQSGLDDLDDYVETHIHGAVRVSTDVAAIVLDPSFVGTAVHAAAHQLGCPIEFHAGFTASPDALDPEYRGAHIVELARRLGTELTPRIIGDAAHAGTYPAQTLKQLWHCLARFGRHNNAKHAPPSRNLQP